MSLFQFSVLFGFVIIILEIGFTQSRIDKSRQELESIYQTIDAMKDLLQRIDDKLREDETLEEEVS